jgi:hypothetical protein
MKRTALPGGGALCVVLFLAVPSSARAGAISLDLPASPHLLETKLRPIGGGGDSLLNAPLIHPVLGEVLAGLGASLVTVPLVLLAGSALGTDSPNLELALLPPVILFLGVPALAVTFAEWGTGRALGDAVSIQPAIYVALGIQVVMLVGVYFIGVSTHDLRNAALFSLVDVILLPASVTGTMNLQLGLQAAAAPPHADTDPRPDAQPVAGRALVSDRASSLSLFARAF